MFQSSNSVEVPIWGEEIKASNVGKCELALSMVLEANGKISIKASLEEEFDLKCGVKGKTYAFVPISYHPTFEIKTYCNTHFDIQTQMTVFTGPKASTKLKIKGMNALDMSVKTGLEGTVQANLNTLSADAGLRVKSVAKLFGQKFELYNRYFSLWQYQKANQGGYKIDIYEACAYGDYVAGKVTDQLGKPYKGQLELRLRNPNGQTTDFNVVSGEDGIFIARDIPLRKGDKVSIRVSNKGSFGQEVEASLPFKEVNLLYADYFKNEASVIVAAASNEWASKAGQTTEPTAVKMTGIAGQGKNLMNPNVAAAAKKIEDFTARLRTYKGQSSSW